MSNQDELGAQASGWWGHSARISSWCCRLHAARHQDMTGTLEVQLTRAFAHKVLAYTTHASTWLQSGWLKESRFFLRASTCRRKSARNGGCVRPPGPIFCMRKAMLLGNILVPRGAPGRPPGELLGDPSRWAAGRGRRRRGGHREMSQRPPSERPPGELIR